MTIEFYIICQIVRNRIYIKNKKIIFYHYLNFHRNGSWTGVKHFWCGCQVPKQEGTLYYPKNRKTILTSIAYANQKYLRGIWIGEKLFIRCSQVKGSHIKGKEVSNILHFAGKNGNILDYLPEYDYAKDLNSELIWNLINIIKIFRVEFLLWLGSTEIRWLN